MKEDFKAAFQNELDIEVDFGPVMRFALVREKPHIKQFVFVEGSTDKTFYESTNISVLSDNAYYFYRTLSDKYDKQDYKGKEAVFYSLKRIVDNERLSTKIDKCKFIVDRDYTKVQRSKYTKLKPVDYSRVTVTKGHSMESYFLEETNLRAILKKAGLNTEEFLKLFDEFKTEMSYFYSLKAVVTDNYKTGANIRFSKKYDDSELFVFDFSKKKFWLGQDKVKEECQRMKRALSSHTYLIRQAEALQKEIVSNRMMVRGHDAFSFLEQYIQQKAHKQIIFPKGNKRDLKMLIGNFNVELCN